MFNIYMGIELVANVRLIEQLRTATASVKLTWDNGGMFIREMDGGLEDDEIKDLVASANQFDLRPHQQIYHSYHAFKTAQHADMRTVTVGRFVAFHVECEDVKMVERQRFWVGRVIDVSDTDLTVHYYHSGVKRDSR